MTPLVKTFSICPSVPAAFQVIAGRKNPFVLESSLKDSRKGRYTLIGCDPFRTISSTGKNFLQELERAWKPWADAAGTSRRHFPFEGGLVGCLSYDYGLRLHNIESRHVSAYPDGVFGLYDVVCILDHVEKKTHIVSTGFPENHPSQRRAYAQHRLKEWQQLLSNLESRTSKRQTAAPVYVRWEGNFSKSAYVRAVKSAKTEIARGEIYQVNLSQKLSCDFKAEASAWPHVYARLRQFSPSCFGGYFQAGDFAVISSSPERFVCSDGDVVQTIPMKGTRRRGKTPQEDARLKRDLLDSEKDKAELVMITDLMRNDLGRVCRYGSVRVSRPRTMETYKTVFQTTSTVEGVIADDVTPFDVLRQTFPGGSVTGCPKIRSMQIIDRLEPEARGFYTGSMGYVGFNGRMDFNILIRTIMARADQLSFHVGGGVVADSDPEREYEETLVKAAGLKRAIESL